MDTMMYCLFIQIRAWWSPSGAHFWTKEGSWQAPSDLVLECWREKEMGVERAFLAGGMG